MGGVGVITSTRRVMMMRHDAYPLACPMNIVTRARKLGALRRARGVPRVGVARTAAVLWAMGLIQSGLICSAVAQDAGESAGQAGGASSPAWLPAPLDRYPVVHGKPSFLTDEEWQGVQASARASSNPEQETARIVDYMHFQKSYFRWMESKDKDPKGARVLARQLLEQLPMQVRRGAVGADQAYALEYKLVEYLEPDAARRARLLYEQDERMPVQPKAPAALTR